MFWRVDSRLPTPGGSASLVCQAGFKANQSVGRGMKAGLAFLRLLRAASNMGCNPDHRWPEWTTRMDHRCGAGKKKAVVSNGFLGFGGVDGTRTRDPRRDRPVPEVRIGA